MKYKSMGFLEKNLKYMVLLIIFFSPTSKKNFCLTYSQKHEEFSPSPSSSCVDLHGAILHEPYIALHFTIMRIVNTSYLKKIPIFCNVTLFVSTVRKIKHFRNQS